MGITVDVGDTERRCESQALQREPFWAFSALYKRAGEVALAVKSMMSQVDPWEKAADCERALMLTDDPIYRGNLTNIREFWISLAHKRAFLSTAEFAHEAEAIGRLHANLSAATQVH